MMAPMKSALLTVFLALSATAAEHRAFWVETFNTPLGTAADVMRVIDAAGQSNANSMFVQVRRRGDSWYLDSLEPLTEVPGAGEPDASGRWTFDPLRYLIEQAHVRNIQVHAFVIVGSVKQGDTLPRSPDHVFLRHIWDRDANAPYPITDRRQWATRALPHNLAGTSHGGQRFGTEWYIDLGHPDAAAYTVDVLAHLLRRYDLDGIHLDRIRYPEAPLDGGTAVNVGYNAASVARFNTVHGRNGDPATGDPLWSQWRRDQVTAFVRRLYLTAKAIRPRIVVSAALITFGDGPSARGGFDRTEPYWRVFQDWQTWAREGILDAVVPMIYKRDSVPAQRTQFDDWLRFTVSLADETGRLGVAGIASYLNSASETRAQWMRAREAGADGVVFYALASATPDLFSILAAEPPTAPSPNPPFAGLMGSHPTPDVTVVLRGTDGTVRTLRTDGNGFYGAVVPPGEYTIEECSITVRAGAIAERNLPCVSGPRRRTVRH
jgi:uncharacterized lipoprotein YddW (UPF0748 family)